jgi:mRNA interferase MazF
MFRGRQEVIDSRFSRVVCAPLYTRGYALGSQVAIGPDEGMKHDSWVVCDNLASVRKTELTQFTGSLSFVKVAKLDEALRIGLALG